MKRYLFVSAIAALALNSCSSDDFLGDTAGNTPSAAKLKEISFGGTTGKITRAEAQANTDKTGADAAAALGNNFIVYGEKTKDGETSTVYNYYNVNWKSTGENNQEAWVYAGEAKNTLNTKGENQTIKYWDYSATSYDFTAFSLGNSKDITVTRTTETTGSPIYTLTGKVADLQNCFFADRKIVKNEENNKEFGQPVKFTFRSTGTKVGMGIYEDIPGYSIKEIRFYDSDESDNPIIRPVLYANNACIPVSDATGTLKVTFDSDNKATSTLTKDAEGEETTDVSSLMLGNSFNLTEDKEFNETKNAQDKYLGRKKSSRTSTGEKVVSPRKITGGLTLKIDYTLISTDGSGEEITVKGATAKIPETYTDWKSNYVYTYIFKITEDTNGSTGGSETGLKPIVFDALVTEDIAGSQTTETTFDKNGNGTTKDITNESQTTE